MDRAGLHKMVVLARLEYFRMRFVKTQSTRLEKVSVFRILGGSTGPIAPVLAAVLLMGMPFASSAQVNNVHDRNPSPMEQIQLPQYCLGQFHRDRPEYRDPKFNLGTTFPNCGPGMNHFCPGILWMVRANAPGSSSQHRKYWLQQARQEFDYTVRAMQQYPNCGLRPHLDLQMKKLQVMMLAP